MAKKATNYGQTGIIEEIGFFRGEEKKTVKKSTPKKKSATKKK